MKLLDKLIKVLGVTIAGLVVTIVVIAGKKGYIKMPNISNPENSKEMEEEIDSELHPELIESYQEYVENIASEIRQVGRDGSITDVFAAYEYLEENGLISLGDDFKHEHVDFEIAGNYGINVATGSALSRNQASNFMNVAAALGYEVHLVNGYLYYDEEKTDELNHCLCYAKIDGHTILIDPANRTIFLKDGGVYRSIDKEYLVFKPDVMYDKSEGYYPDNKGFYKSTENVYDDCFWIADEFFVKREAMKDNAEFFGDYELANLLEYEQFISDYIDECSKNIETQEEGKRLLREGE